MSEFKLPCNCTWALGIGPNLLCPVHGSSHHISATLTEARGKITKLRERIALLEAAILNLKTLVEYAYGEGWDDGCCYDDTNDSLGIPSTGGIAADWAESKTKKLLQEQG
jgi:hypothetical protein